MHSQQAFVVIFLLCSTVRADSRLRGEVQLSSKDRSAKVLSELGTAERMVQEELRGHPKLIKEEMQLLRGAEDAARGAQHAVPKVSHGVEFVQQKAEEGLTGQLLGELSTAKHAVEQALQGHPKELAEEEKALSQAEAAAHHMGRSAVHTAALLETTVSEGKSLLKTEAAMGAFEEQRSQTMATALQEERSYAAAEDGLAKDGTKVLSEFASIKDAIAEAFAGKDSRAVKKAMEVGELMDGAREEQQKVVKGQKAEAARAKKDAAAHAAVFAQMSTQSKAAQEQRAYTSGMAKLAKDGKAILTELSEVKGAVAQAFAGKDSKAVEKAMEVGELLDQARQEQQQVTEKDQKEATSSKFFGKLGPKPRMTAFIEWQGRSTSAKARRTMRLKSLAHNEHRILLETERAKAAVKHAFAARGDDRAQQVQSEVLDAIAKAELAEQGAFTATSIEANKAESKA